MVSNEERTSYEKQLGHLGQAKSIERFVLWAVLVIAVICFIGLVFAIKRTDTQYQTTLNEIKAQNSQILDFVSCVAPIPVEQRTNEVIKACLDKATTPRPRADDTAAPPAANPGASATPAPKNNISQKSNSNKDGNTNSSGGQGGNQNPPAATPTPPPTPQPSPEPPRPLVCRLTLGLLGCN